MVTRHGCKLFVLEVRLLLFAILRAYMRLYCHEIHIGRSLLQEGRATHKVESTNGTKLVTRIWPESPDPWLWEVGRPLNNGCHGNVYSHRALDDWYSGPTPSYSSLHTTEHSTVVQNGQSSRK
jgi:hypothetical protein